MSADSPGTQAPARLGVASGEDLVDRMLDAAITLEASDVHVKPASPPMARLEGRLVPLANAVWGSEATESFCRRLAGEHWDEVERVGTTDFGLPHPTGNHFRVNILKQRTGYGAVLRLIPKSILSFEEIGLPPVIEDLLRRPRGLILVTGPTGSGKTTTLATMIDWINSNLERHIVTIEDPVEYHHDSKMSLVTQREVGTDVPDFVEAMRRVLRQDPDVIMVGEMRDLETIAAAVSAAETGHLVLGTLHTTGSATTVSRIIDAFPSGQQAQIRVQLAMSLAAVISQVLIPTTESGESGRRMVAALEVMTMTQAIANQIRTNDINRINDVLQTSRHLGMQRLDDHLHKLVGEGTVEPAVALAFAQDPTALKARLGVGARQGR